MRFGRGYATWTGGIGPAGGDFDPGHHPHRGRHHGGRGRRRMFEGGELKLVLLRLIAETPRHGYDLIREIEERTGGAYAPSPGVVYPTLTLLTEMGLIEERESEGAKKQFGVTAEGEAHLAEQAGLVDAILARLTKLASVRERADADVGPVRRAMGNLKAVLQNRLAADPDAETLHAVADLIDEAAKKIERL